MLLEVQPKLVEIRFPHEQCAFRKQPLQHSRIVLRTEILQGTRSIRRGQRFRVDAVLDRDGESMEQAKRGACGSPLVGIPCCFHREGAVQRSERVQVPKRFRPCEEAGGVIFSRHLTVAHGSNRR
jgi:hypothetical protein